MGGAACLKMGLAVGYLSVLLGRSVVCWRSVSGICLDKLLNEIVSSLHESLLDPHLPSIEPDSCSAHLMFSDRSLMPVHNIELT